MKLSFSTLGCPDWSLPLIADNAKKMGYDGVELRVHPDGRHLHPETAIEEVKRIGKMFRDTGAPIVSAKTYTKFAFLDDKEVEAQQKTARRNIAIAEAIGAKFIRTFAGQIPAGADKDAMTEKVAKALKPLAAEAADKGIRFGLEIHDDWCAGQRVMNVARIIDNKRGFGIVYDIYNAFHSGIESWDATYKLVKDHICYCHVKDGYNAGRADGHPTYVMIGAGDLPIKEIVQAFKRDGFDSYFSLEWEKMWYPEMEGPERIFPHYVHKMKALWNGEPQAKAAH